MDEINKLQQDEEEILRKIEFKWPLNSNPSSRRIIVGFSGGVTSAWCAFWALMFFPKHEVIFLFHDTKEEDIDTYRFIKEFSSKVDHPITEFSDGRSVTELCYDENCLPNDRMAFCSRKLKYDQRNKFINILRNKPFTLLDPIKITEIIIILGFTSNEWMRMQRMHEDAKLNNYTVRFPLAENKINKSTAANFIQCTLGIKLPRMYEWSGHANCVGCVRGGLNYWQAVKKNRPDIFAQRMQLEKEFNHSFMTDYFLKDIPLPSKKWYDKESINIGSCECGD